MNIFWNNMQHNGGAVVAVWLHCTPRELPQADYVILKGAGKKLEYWSVAISDFGMQH